LLHQLYGEDGEQGEVEGVRYLNIVTSHDDMVTPFTNGVMTIPEESKDTLEATPSHSWQLQNLIIESHCDFNPDYSNHFGIFQSPFAFHATDIFLSSSSESDFTSLLDSGAISCTLDPESPHSD
jgi:hypothetical protein